MDSYAVAQDMAWANRTFEGDVKQLLDADFDSVKIVRKKPPEHLGSVVLAVGTFHVLARSP